MKSLTNEGLSDEHRIMFFQNLKKKLNGIPTRKIASIVRIILTTLKSKIRVNHLDELVDALITEDQRLGTRLFKSEIETLNFVILILKQIQVSFEKLGLNILPHTMERELQGAMIDEAY